MRVHQNDMARRLTQYMCRRPSSRALSGVSPISGARRQQTTTTTAAITSQSIESSHYHPSGKQQWFRREHSGVNSFAPFFAVAGGLALLSSSATSGTATKTEAEPSERRPSNQAAPIDWNVVFSMSQEDDQEDDQEASKKKEDTQEGDDDDIDAPSYINEFARKDLGDSLNRHASVGTEARNILKTEAQYPLLRAELTMAPHVPPPCNRNYPVHLVVDLMTVNKKMRVQGSKTYEFWPYAFLDQHEGKVKYGVPGPFIRARVGDILQVNHTNKDESGMAHSVDFHSVCGPGGGSPTTFAEQDETRTGAYRLMKPGLYLYHCAAAPIPLHIHNGMFGLLLVEPDGGLPPVEKEFYVMQHELYLNPEDNDPNATEYEHDYDAATREIPSHVVFNGRENSLVDNPLIAKQDERVRIFFGNAGPNLISSFHIIGAVFDKCYREGDLVSHPAQYIQTTLVPSGGVTVVEMKMQVPGNFALIDHSINRIDKGAVGFLKVKGTPRPDIYDSAEPPQFCPGCKTHN